MAITMDDVGLEEPGREILVGFAGRTCAQVTHYDGHCEGWHPGSRNIANGFDWNRGLKAVDERA